MTILFPPYLFLLVSEVLSVFFSPYIMCLSKGLLWVIFFFFRWLHGILLTVDKVHVFILQFGDDMILLCNCDDGILDVLIKTV